MLPHQHTVAGVLGLPGLVDFTDGEADFDYLVDKRLDKVTVRRPDGTIRELFQMAYNLNKTVHTCVHTTFEADGFTAYRTILYTVTYNPNGTVSVITAV